MWELIVFAHDTEWVLRKQSLNQHLEVGAEQHVERRLALEPYRCGSCEVIWNELCSFLAIQLTIP